MRNTSRVLGIIGATISMLFGLFLIAGGAVFLDSDVWGDRYDSSGGLNDVMPKTQYIQETSTAGTVFLGFGIAATTAGVLGLVGGIIVKRRNVASGVMMIIAAVICFFTFFNVASTTLFIIGAVMAMRREPQPLMVPYPAYPPQYCPYPPQQYPPYPQPPVQNPPKPPK